MSARASLHLSITRALPVPRIDYSLEFDADAAALVARAPTRTRTLLSLRVLAQDAREMPVDVVVRIWGAPRPYVIRRGIIVGGLDEELVDDGIVTDAYCSLDADGFSRTALAARRVNDAHVLVARTAPHATLLRNVVRSLVRAPYHEPLLGSDYTLYTHDTLVDEAVEYIEQRLVPHAERVLCESHCSAVPLTLDSWPDAFAASSSSTWRATLRVQVYLVVE